MASEKLVICKLCFKIQDNLDEFKAIDDDVNGILDIVLHKMDVTAIQNPVMCTNCADTLMKCFHFKTKCINTRDYIAPYTKDNVKLDLIELYASKSETGTGVLEVQDVCGLCMSLLKNCSVRSVDSEGDVALKKMIEQCVPEMDMNVIKKPVICLPCHGSLENYFRFLTNCLVVEEKIKKYSESPGEMDQSRLLELATVDFTGKVGGSLTDLIKVENQFCEEIEKTDKTGVANGGDEIKIEQMSGDDGEYSKEEFQLKNECFMEVDELKFSREDCFTAEEELVCKNVIKIEKPFFGGTGLEEGDLVGTEDQKVLNNEEIQIKTDESEFNRFEDGILRQSKLGKIHLRTHKDPSVVIMYKCDSCSFETKYKNSLGNHLIRHKDPSEVTLYKCDSCSFETKHQRSLESHFLKHKNPSEVIMYKCESCSYQSNNKNNIKRHSLRHKDPSEVYRCDSCSYQSITKYCFKRHLLKHKDPSVVTMLKCDFCSYQTKSKQHLKKHLVVHKDPSELTMYKCDWCTFETKHKRSLESHCLIHKNSSAVTVYKCDSCPYQTKVEASLKRHFLQHKDLSEVTMYKCDSCSFETKYKYSLCSHFLKHKDPSEVTMYKCDSCLFETKHKMNLRGHLLKHRDPSRVTMYKCDSCPFETKRKRNLANHLLKHKGPSKVTRMYKCDSCPYQTNDRGNLTRHLLKHKDPSEVTMYKCDFCSFQTKSKGYLKKHLLRHDA